MTCCRFVFQKHTNPPTHRDERVEHLSYRPTYLPNFPFFFSYFLPKKKNAKRRFTSSLFSSLPPARDTLTLPGLLGTYFFQCQFSHRFLLIFWWPFDLQQLQKWIQKRAKVPPETYPKIRRKLSREITRKSWTYYKKAKCQNLKNHAPVWTPCTFSQSS